MIVLKRAAKALTALRSRSLTLPNDLQDFEQFGALSFERLLPDVKAEIDDQLYDALQLVWSQIHDGGALAEEARLLFQSVLSVRRAIRDNPSVYIPLLHWMSVTRDGLALKRRLNQVQRASRPRGRAERASEALALYDERLNAGIPKGRAKQVVCDQCQISRRTLNKYLSGR